MTHQSQSGGNCFELQGQKIMKMADHYLMANLKRAKA